MPPRWPLLVAALVLSLGLPSRAVAADPSASPETTAPPSAPSTDGNAGRALQALRSAADRPVRVHRDSTGDVAFVASTDGRAMLDGHGSTPRRSAQEQLAAYGDAFGIDGTTSRAVVTQTVGSATGGSVVRAQQVVDGVPVFGGQLVMSLDDHQGLVSVASATTAATQVPAPVVSEATARDSAVAVTAKGHHVATSTLSVSAMGQRLYDPALVHNTDPMGVRPVWQFEVTNGADIRETVLVGTGRGEIALQFDDTPELLNRRVCDNLGLQTTSSASAVPICTVAARSEGDHPSLTSDDVNHAYDNLGETAQAYADLDGKDLTVLIGATVSSQKTLQSTVRWCYSDMSCPYTNAFWDGTQMVFGAGYAAADDVVGHELTHGYVERTSNLFSLHQSGAINESLADTIGEIVDHRNGTDDDSAWQMGELVPGGAIRSMKDPTLFGQPDRMTSPLFVASDVTYDNGAVHDNDGVGNKTAYLISQGGTFNGRTVTGIDGSDPGLAKTGRLYLEAIPRLTSGADYAQLGDVLTSTCQQLAGAGTGGFTSTDCTSVSAAVAATELSTPPTAPVAAAPKVAVGCPTGSTLDLLKRDDDAQHDFGFTLGTLWQRTPTNQTPANAESGTSSLFGWDPDPAYQDPATSSATTAGFTVPTGAPTYLNFHHAYLFEFSGTQYYDGGEVIVQQLVNGAWATVSGLPWVNGATRTRAGTSTQVFGGDSLGYGSSQVDLTSLAGQTVRVLFQVEGDDSGSYYGGWWVDDIRLYACEGAPAPVAPTAPTAASVRAGVTSAVVSWQPPSDPGSSAIASYRITRSDGRVDTASAADRSKTLTGLAANTAVNVSVAAVNQEGLAGPARTVSIYGTTTTVTTPATAARGVAFNITAKVTRRGTTSLVTGMPVTLQRHVKGETVWRTVGTGTTSYKGTRSWSVTQSRLTYYRVVSSGVASWLGTTSTTRTVSMR